MPEVRNVLAWGEVSYFVNPEGRLKRGAYFATIKTTDGENDRASALHRDGVWRLNFGLSKADFVTLFGPPPTRPAKGHSIIGPWDLQALYTLTPHPVYGWMGWVAVLCPDAGQLENLRPLIALAHAKARAAAQVRLTKEAA